MIIPLAPQVRRILPLAALTFLLADVRPVAAGWDNVFQVCCNDCRPKARTSYSCDTCAPPPPKPEKRVEYRRSYYYEPVTVMKPEVYTEEVPVQVKSYYWEPVTKYTYTSYYDPCSNACQQIAVPRTSYVRKESCNTVMKYVERTRMVPVQVQRKVEVTQPVVTYYYPETRKYTASECELPPSGGAAAPKVDELRSAPQGGGAQSGEFIPPPNIPTTPNSRPKTMAPTAPVGKVNAHTTSRSGPATVRGEIVNSDQVTPRSGAKMVFVSASNTDRREYVVADQFGNFDTKLPSGEWHVYLGNGDGKATFHKTIAVGEYDTREFKVVSR